MSDKCKCKLSDLFSGRLFNNIDPFVYDTYIKTTYTEPTDGCTLCVNLRTGCLRMVANNADVCPIDDSISIDTIKKYY